MPTPTLTLEEAIKWIKGFEENYEFSFSFDQTELVRNLIEAATIVERHRALAIINKMKMDENFSGHYQNGYIMAQSEAYDKILRPTDNL